MVDPTKAGAPVFTSENPGRDCQRVATARFLGQDPALIHEPVWGAIGNSGDSICYAGVDEKLNAINSAIGRAIATGGVSVRLIKAEKTIAASDGQLNGKPQMKNSLIGREVTNDAVDEHVTSNEMEAIFAVVACDKPPVGTAAALLEHNKPAIMVPDGSIKPYFNPKTGKYEDIVECFKAGGSKDQQLKNELALNACPGYGSCGGMFTYNSMQLFFGVLGMEPIDMISPVSEDKRRTEVFPDQLVGYMKILVERDIKPRDIVTVASLRNATIMAMAVGASTNVVLHAPEIARAAGIDFWEEVMSQEEFNQLSREVPVLTNARPYGEHSMVDIDKVGGAQVIVKELLQAGLLDGSTITCTGETLTEQIERLDPPMPDGSVIHTLENPFQQTGGLRLLKGNLAPEGGAVLKVAGVEGGLVDNRFEGKARVFNGEFDLLHSLSQTPEVFENNDIVVIRYEGPQGAPGMPEMLDPTSRITTLCKERNIVIALMTDARFSGGSTGLVVGHVLPEAFNGGPIALVEDGDKIIIDLNQDTISCRELDDPVIHESRQYKWDKQVAANGGIHPDARQVVNRLYKRMRAMASTALDGAGMSGPNGVPEMIPRD